MALRAAMHRAGAAALTELLRTTAPVEMAVSCRCGHPARYHQMRPKQLLTVLGRLEIERAYYVCPHCHQGQSPRDRELDVEGVACSPGVRRMMAVVGSESSFEQGREQLELLAGIAVTAKAVERQAEAIGADIEAGTDKEGRPVRDEDSTTYVAAIETAEEFGLRLYSEAWRRGWSRAPKKVVIGDGAVWLWNIADQHFPGAIQIVDLYHARQHLWDLSAKLFPDDDPARKRWLARCLARLDQGKIEALVKILRDFQPATAELAKTVTNEAQYFERNPERMRYPSFRAQGLFVGSGVVEAGCKEVIGSRLKRSGMFWTVRGANAIIALRCCRLSGRFEDYWEARSPAA